MPASVSPVILMRFSKAFDWNLFGKAVWPPVEDPGLGVKPDSPSAASYRPVSPHSICNSYPQCPHPEWKPDEDRSRVLLMVTSWNCVGHLVIHISYWLNE